MIKDKSKGIRWWVVLAVSLISLILAMMMVPFLGGHTLLDYFMGEVGVKVHPSEILFECGMGKVQTISLTNYDNKLKANVPLTISWYLEDSLIIELEDLDEAVEGQYISYMNFIELSEPAINHEIYFIPSIESGETFKFLLKISGDCEGKSLISFDREVMTMEGIYFNPSIAKQK
jgi:hypothetical protein